MNRNVWMVSPVPLFPTNAGNRIRVLALVGALRQLGYTIHFIHVEEEQGDTDKMRAFFGEEAFFAIPRKRNKSAATFLRKGIKKITDYLPPYLLKTGFYVQNALDDYCDPSLVAQVRAILANKPVDVLLVEYVFMSSLFAAAPPNARKVLDTHDLFTDRFKLYSAKGRRYRWFSTSRKNETKGFSRADSVLAIQDKEGAVMKSMTGQDRVEVVGHLTEVEPLPFENAYGISYMASDNKINELSINQFIENVLPDVVKRFPDTRLYIAGSICKAALSEHPAVVKLGYVDDMRDLYRKSQVVVNPALFGTGLKIKSMEAMGFGKVLIASPDGAMGLDDDNGKRFLMAANWPDYVRFLLKLFADRDSMDRISHEASRYSEACNQEVLQSLKRAFGDETLEEGK